MAHAADDWQRALAWLDQCLALPQPARPAWLEQRRQDHPASAALLARLLAAHERADFNHLLETLAPQQPLPHTAVATVAGQPGMRVGPFELVELLGRGGMGSVWRARYVDGRLRREVAVKLASGSQDQAATNTLRERLVRERDFLAQLEHPHIARVYDAGMTEDGQPFLAMEYVEGLPIDRYADDQRLTVDQRLRLFQQVLDAVAFAHQRLVLHRDLKPGNVLVTADGQVRLLDFGIARLLPDSEQPSGGVGRGAALTEHASFRGASVCGQPPTLSGTSQVLPAGLTGQAGAAYTLAYAAPEQVKGEELSTATDVYSLGVMLYVLLTGLSPYEPRGRSKAALMDAVCHQAPLGGQHRQFSESVLAARKSSSEALRRTMGGDLGAVVGRAISKKPQARYASVDAFAKDLQRALERQPVEARPSTWHYRLERFVSRHRLAVGAGAAAVAALAVSTGLAVNQAKVSRELGEVARREAAQAMASQRFFSRLLSAADPEHGQGGNLSYQRELNGALQAAEAEFAQMPHALALVLKQLGELYIRLDVPEKNLEVQRKRVALMASLGSATADERVDAEIEFARALTYSADPAERGQVLHLAEHALANAHKLGAGPAQVVNALCLLSERYLAQSDSERSFALAEQAVSTAEAAQPPLKAERSLAHSELGISAARVGRFELARSALHRSLELDHVGQGRDRLEQVHTRTVLADVEFDAGNYLQSRQEALIALDAAAEELGPMEGTLLPVRARAVLATLALGDVQEGYALAYRLLLSDARSPDTFRSARASLTLGVASMAAHQFDEAWRYLGAAQGGLAVSPIWEARLRTQQAEWLLRNGRAPEAAAKLSEMLGGIREPRQIERDAYARAFERAGVAAARMGRADEALRLFERSCQGRRRWLDVSHPDRVRCESYLLLLAPGLEAVERQSRMAHQIQLLQQRTLGGTALAKSLSEALSWLRRQRTAGSLLTTFPLLS